MKTAETKIVENKGETAAVEAAGSAMGGDAEETLRYEVTTPFKFKGKDRVKGDRVELNGVQGAHLESAGLVRLPSE